MSAANSNSNGVGVEVRALQKSFNGQEVLKGLNFKVDAGEILINGESNQSPDVMDKYRMAMVFQSGALLNSLTVAENVGLYLSEHRLKPPEEIARIVSENLDLVGLKGTEEKMPSELSG